MNWKFFKSQDHSITIIKVYSYVMRSKYVQLFLATLSLATINFAVYIAYFDINAFSMIDTVAASGHIFRLVILYTVISYVFYLFNSYTEHQSLASSSLSRLGLNLSMAHLKFLSNGNKAVILIDKVIKFIGQLALKFKTGFIEKYYLGKILKTALPLLVFLMLYVGLNGLLIYVASITVVILILFIAKPDRDGFEKLKASFKEDGLSESVGDGDLKDMLLEMERTENEFKLFQFSISKKYLMSFLIDKSWLLLILTSVLIGGLRANFVENHILVSLGTDKDKYSLFMTTSSGIGLYSSAKKQVEFISWDNVTNLTYLQSYRRSYN